MNIHDVISQLVAEKIGETDSTISRFRSGQGGLTIGALQRLLDSYGLSVEPSDGQKRLEDALEVVSDLWKRARSPK